MYVEVSGRQTGKTSRLINHMAHNIINGETNIGIMTYNYGQYKRILNAVIHKVDELSDGQYGGGNQYWYRHVIKYVRTMDRDDLFYYVDEFDYIPTNTTIRVMDNAYYCTSPCVRNTVFTQYLMNYCLVRNIEVIHYPNDQDYIDTSVRCGTDDHAHTELFVFRYGLTPISTITPIRHIKQHRL